MEPLKMYFPIDNGDIDGYCIAMLVCKGHIYIYRCFCWTLFFQLWSAYIYKWWLFLWQGRSQTAAGGGRLANCCDKPPSNQQRVWDPTIDHIASTASPPTPKDVFWIQHWDVGCVDYPYKNPCLDIDRYSGGYVTPSCFFFRKQEPSVET